MNNTAYPTTRKGFLKKFAKGATATAAAGALGSTGAARAAITLDQSFNSPYAPFPVIGHPSSWNVYTGIIPRVVKPYNVIVCNRQLGQLPSVEGLPDMRAVPVDATMLALFHYPAAAPSDASLAVNLDGRAMRFTDMGGGAVDTTGFRRFAGWWTTTQGGTLYSLQLFLFVGPQAGSEWSGAQAIIDSIQVAA